MRIKLLSALCGDLMAAQPGDEIDVAEDEGVRMCLKGLAKPADKESETLLGKRKDSVSKELKDLKKDPNRNKATGLRMLREQATPKRQLETATTDD